MKKNNKYSPWDEFEKSLLQIPSNVFIAKALGRSAASVAQKRGHSVDVPVSRSFSLSQKNNKLFLPKLKELCVRFQRTVDFPCCDNQTKLQFLTQQLAKMGIVPNEGLQKAIFPEAKTQLSLLKDLQGTKNGVGKVKNPWEAHETEEVLSILRQENLTYDERRAALENLYFNHNPKKRSYKAIEKKYSLLKVAQDVKKKNEAIWRAEMLKKAKGNSQNEIGLVSMNVPNQTSLLAPKGVPINILGKTIFLEEGETIKSFNGKIFIAKELDVTGYEVELSGNKITLLKNLS